MDYYKHIYTDSIYDLPHKADPRCATSRLLGHRTLRRNRTCLRAKNYCPQNPVLRFFNHFKERLSSIKIELYFKLNKISKNSNSGSQQKKQ